MDGVNFFFFFLHLVFCCICYLSVHDNCHSYLLDKVPCPWVPTCLLTYCVILYGKAVSRLEGPDGINAPTKAGGE